MELLDNIAAIDSAANKLAMALAYRTMPFDVYCQEHEYSSSEVEQARTAYVGCKEMSVALASLSTDELKELLDAI